MRIIIVRRTPGVSISMDVYTDCLVAALKTVRPEWDITEIAPKLWGKQDNLWKSGNPLRKYYERFWNHPYTVSQQVADIFHIIDHSNAHVAYWLKKTDQRVVVTCHDLVQFIYPEILQEQARFPALSLEVWKYSVHGMRQANHIISVSENTAKDIREMLNINSAKITLIPEAVEPLFRMIPSHDVEVIRRKNSTPNQTICLLNVGSNHQRKNICTVLKALLYLKKKGLPVCLWRVGEEFNVEQKLFIKMNGLEESIYFFNKPDKSTLVAIYNAADILLAPSLYEGFGFTILEAMACGTPVITSNVSSLPEVAGSAAVLVDPMDVKSISESVCKIHNNIAYRQELINNGLTWVNKFSWEKTAEHTATLYEKLLNQRIDSK